MNKADFELFIQFAKIDQEHVKLETQKVRLIKEQEKLLNQLESINQDIKNKADIVHNLKKQIDLAQLELKTIDTDLQSKKYKLDNASSTKEYFSLETEINSIKEKRNSLENIVIELWQQFEIAQKDLTDVEQNGSTRISEIESDLKAVARQLILIEADLNQSKEALSIQEKNINPELLDIYESMKKQVANPVVQVKNNSCSACFFSISAQDIQDIRKEKLTRCKDCFRILYE